MVERVETIRRFFDAFAEGDIDAAIGLMDSEVEWVPAPALPWSHGEYRGPEGVRDYLESFVAALEDGAATPQRIIACEGDEVLALGRGSGRSRETGRSFDIPFAFLFGVRDSRITRLHGHVDTAAIRDAFVPQAE